MPTRDLIFVRVFTDEQRRWGNPLAIVADAGDVADSAAMAIARSAGTSETVFVDDPARGAVRIFVPNGRVPSAGRGGPWVLQQLTNTRALDEADPSGEARHDYVWAWEDEALGHVRARAFTSLSGTVEDEATGSAAVELCAALGRPLRIRQGHGSVIDVRPVGERFELTGRVTRG